MEKFYLIEDAGNLEECKVVSYHNNLSKLLQIREILKEQNKLCNYKVVVELSV